MPDQLKADPIARLSLHDTNNPRIQLSQTLHRVQLVEHWKIPSGAKVLELGCGQGDCTTVLATAVGEQGHVTAVDPADLDYGSPYTIGQAQSHISAGPLGGRITWVQQLPVHYLSTLDSASSAASPPARGSKAFDAAVLAHSLWYFPSTSHILETFRALKKHCKRLYLAEWSLHAANFSAHAHVLAALAQASLECRKPASTSNIRTALSPKRIQALALEAGWKLKEQEPTWARMGLDDAKWEINACLDPSFEQEVNELVSDERERAFILALRDACEASTGNIVDGLHSTKGMEAWAASFV